MGYRDPAATWLGSPNFSLGRPGDIAWIVLHTMVGTVASANARFQNPAQLASAHYGVGLDGSKVQWVDEGDTAWHAGNFALNQAAIGIEHEDGGDYNGIRPDSLYIASSVLVAAISSRYGIPVQRGDYAAGVPGCIDHRTVYATACPDALDTDRIIRGAQRFGPGGQSLTGGDMPALLRNPDSGVIYQVGENGKRPIRPAEFAALGRIGQGAFADVAAADLEAIPDALTTAAGGLSPEQAAQLKESHDEIVQLWTGIHNL